MAVDEMEHTEFRIREDERDKILDRLINIKPSELIDPDNIEVRGWHSWRFARLYDAIRGELERSTQ